MPELLPKIEHIGGSTNSQPWVVRELIAGLWPWLTGGKSYMIKLFLELRRNY